MGRTRVTKAKPKKATDAAQVKGDSLYARMMALHEPAYAKFEAGRKESQERMRQMQRLRSRKDKSAYNAAFEAEEEQEQKEEAEKEVRACKEALSVMKDTATPLPPYVTGSSLAKEAVKVIEGILLQKGNYKHGYGCKSIGFGRVVHVGVHGAVLDPLVPIPGWPVWPEGVHRRVVRWFSKQCMHQILQAFIETHPEFTLLPDDEDSLVYPCVGTWRNEATFWWAQE